MQTQMEIGEFTCGVHLPPAPEGGGVHRLPPSAIQPVYKVDEYPACPANWMHGSGLASSYFFAVEPGRHLWLDFNGNAMLSHHVAVVLSVQGINPITGQPSKVLRLEQYREKCPVHHIKFGEGRFCPECGYQWPPQNYMSTTCWPHGRFWIDGWRVEDGTIRGFLITDETLRGVAQQLIGEDRVWAIGIAFYRSIEPKPQVSPLQVPRSVPSQLYGMCGQSVGSCVCTNAVMAADSLGFGNVPVKSVEPVATKQIEIAAGAKIGQRLDHCDHKPLDFYEEAPAGVLYANYCTPTELDRILAAGKRDLTAGGEGFLAGLKTGN